MSRDFELRNEVANQVMDAISAKVLDSPLPSQVILASYITLVEQRFVLFYLNY